MVVDVRFAAHHGLKSDIAPSPGSASNGLMRCSKMHLDGFRSAPPFPK